MLVRNLREGPKWISGTIIEQTGPVSYRVQVQDQVWRTHTDQILDQSSSSQTTIEIEDVPGADALPPDTSPIPTSERNDSVQNESVAGPSPVPNPQPLTENRSVPDTQTSVTKQYPRRERKPPDRLSHQTC